MSHMSSPSQSDKGFRLQATIAWGTRSWDLEALVDLGAEAKFIDQDLVAKMGIPTQPVASPVKAVSLSGGLIDYVSLSTKPLWLISSPQTPLVLSQLWLQLHDPTWSTGKAMEWSKYCLATCLLSARLPGEAKLPHPKCLDLSQVPSEYYDQAKVFCKSIALSLPPHRL